jgi:thiol:disulfide interchange protein DsbD
MALRIALARPGVAAAAVLALGLPGPAHPQGLAVQADVPAPEEMVKVQASPVALAPGGQAIARVELEVLPGWHVNANPPALDYLIPTEVRLEAAAGIAVGPARYPPPQRAKLAFEDAELLVYDGRAVVEIPLRAEPEAATGERALGGKVRFQACNDQVCLPPASLGFAVAVQVTRPAAWSAAPPGPPAPSPAPPPAEGFATAPPPGGVAATARDPIGRLLERGSVLAFLSLFAIGLALNLTPCVYPMLGVTVSLFGARRAGPTARVLGHALLYVLGIAVTYSTLGLAAALTGGLFGGFLQSPVVLALIGVLLFAMALSMFGVYELQVPSGLLAKLGGAGAASALGLFASGLVVGLFAAPCIGPPVVALLAVVGAKGDPWFGFTTFFTLSLGLGAPYLVLATFSNLMQRLPRSGEWMVWVKKLFGVVLLGVASFYLLLGIAPKWATWALPASLIAGGLYLGFLERSGGLGRAFRRFRVAAGAAALLAGIAIVATTPREGIAFRPYDPAEVRGATPRPRPVMLDFSADWCVPCHELERYTFTDRRVREEARAFDAYKVDLTRYDSPEVEGWRRQYAISGVPTIVFLDVAGNEIREARVEGFLPPGPFLERLRLAARRAQAGPSQASAR